METLQAIYETLVIIKDQLKTQQQMNAVMALTVVSLENRVAHLEAKAFPTEMVDDDNPPATP